MFGTCHLCISNNSLTGVVCSPCLCGLKIVVSPQILFNSHNYLLRNALFLPLYVNYVQLPVFCLFCMFRLASLFAVYKFVKIVLSLLLNTCMYMYCAHKDLVLLSATVHVLIVQCTVIILLYICSIVSAIFFCCIISSFSWLYFFKRRDLLTLMTAFASNLESSKMQILHNRLLINMTVQFVQQVRQ